MRYKCTKCALKTFGIKFIYVENGFIAHSVIYSCTTHKCGNS